ncbi:hypothetical protein [Streptomyces sp. HC307]|uniref:hypothetical protein n=1 Tax=Streptomyces flavusporus TaxID=3385496 RepID=UPI003916FF62
MLTTETTTDTASVSALGSAGCVQSRLAQLRRSDKYRVEGQTYCETLAQRL